MNLDQIETKSFIMALFIRDDNERFLLGTGAYEFKDSQLHFAGNTIENDVVSIQGNDGYMLAGQVRRPNTQVFDGYIGDATTTKSEVEGFRRDFFAFFRKNHFYTVVYIMADGSAIQRRKGFLVDAPTVKELWQMYPEYHVGFNFEDINYYNYTENAQGEETYGKSADVGLAKAMYGGLIWEEDGITTTTGTGTNITLAGTMEGGAIESVELNGDTTQTTYSGKNLLPYPYNVTSGTTSRGITITTNNDGTAVLNGKNDNTGQTVFMLFNDSDNPLSIPAGTYYFPEPASDATFGYMIYTGSQYIAFNSGVNFTRTFTSSISARQIYIFVNQGVTTQFNNKKIYPMFTTSAQHTEADYEPYVGGTASPNPDYPQNVNVVTGRQVVTISDGGSESQEYEINLGKNLFDKDNGNVIQAYIGNTFVSNAYNRTVWIACQPNTTYTLQKTSTGRERIIGWSSEVPAIGGVVGGQLGSFSGSVPAGDIVTATVTTPAGANYLAITVYQTSQDSAYTLEQILASLQIEKGSTATSYAPYFTPIELCKIGTYQDYIYKSGEDWYVHKDISKIVLDGSQSVTSYGTAVTGKYRYSVPATGAANVAADVVVNVSDKFVGVTRGDTYSNVNGMYQATGLVGFYWDAISAYTTAQVQTWLSTNNVIAYYPLATPTDTQITNATLISELEGLLSATTYSGTTYIAVSGDLASPLEVVAEALDGGGVEWDANGAVWEDGGGGATTVVTVDSIDSVYPVWTVTGKSVNPVLTNLTTAMSISYDGTIAQGQTLVVDLLNKTAKLNGTSVIQNISGSWVEFAPGNNQVSYTTDNSDAPDSTIEWQEIVG